MSRDTTDWGLTPADDDLHEASDDPWWTETVWFAWMVPERRHPRRWRRFMLEALATSGSGHR